MECRCWPKLLLLSLFSFLIGSVFSQITGDFFISDSIACDTFPPPRNLNAYGIDNVMMVWWEPPLIEDSYLQKDAIVEDQLSTQRSINKKVRSVDISQHSNSAIWDVQVMFACGATGEYGIETDGNYIYTSKANAGSGWFFQYELDGDFNGPVTVPGCQDVLDMAYNDHDELFYGSDGGNIIWGIDFNTLSVVNTITTSYPCRAIAYDPEQLAFWCNNWNSDICMIDMVGALISSFPLIGYKSISGLAWEDTDYLGPSLWGFSAEGGGAELIQMDINSGGTQVFSIDISTIVGGSNAPGGLYTHCALYEDYAMTIGGIRQDEIIFAIEYEFCMGLPNPFLITPENLLGYKLYRDDIPPFYIPYNEEDTSFYYDTINNIYPPVEVLTYNVSALYDVSECGFPGDTMESEFEGPISVYTGWPIFILPFVEDWNTGSFDPNLWTKDEYWSISGDNGNPIPCAVYNSSADTSYSQSLISYWINCSDHPGTSSAYIDGDFFLEFELMLNDFTSSGTDLMKVQYTDSVEWQTIVEFSNIDGSFPWTYNKINITEHAKGKFIKIAFVAEGTNGSNIHSWLVDNIVVRRECNPPLELHWEIVDTLIAWSPAMPHTGTKENGSREFIQYLVYDNDALLEITTDTFHYFDNAAGYGPFFVGAQYEDCMGYSNSIFGLIGIKEKPDTEGIKIFPNPANNQVTILADEKIDQIRIFNTNGKRLFQKLRANTQEEIDITEFANGLYIAEILIDDKNIRKKFIIHHQ